MLIYFLKFSSQQSTAHERDESIFILVLFVYFADIETPRFAAKKASVSVIFFSSG